MSAKPNHFKIGLFVLIGIVVLILALFAFGARNYFEEKTVFETYITTDVEGLSVGSPVKFQGVTMGKVTWIGFPWARYPEAKSRYVVVEFELRDRLAPQRSATDHETLLTDEIARGLRARVTSQGITGTSIVTLDYMDPEKNPPLEVPWKPRNYYIPSAPGQLGQMLSSIEKTLSNIEKMDLAALSTALERDLVGVEDLLKRVQKMDFDKFGTNVNSLVAELGETNQKLQLFITETTVSVKGMNLQGVAKNADQMLIEIKGVAERIDQILGTLDTSSLNDTLGNAREATDNLNDVLRELKQYPSGFLFGQPPPPARSLERKGN